MRGSRRPWEGASDTFSTYRWLGVSRRRARATRTNRHGDTRAPRPRASRYSASRSKWNSIIRRLVFRFTRQRGLAFKLVIDDAIKVFAGDGANGDVERSTQRACFGEIHGFIDGVWN